MFVACKIEEIYPLKITVVHEKIAHKKLSPEAIRKKEREILSALNYDVTGVTLFEFVENLLNMADIKKLKLPDAKFSSYLDRVVIYLAKMVMFDYELISTFTYKILAVGVLFVSFKIIEQFDPNFVASDEIKQIIGFVGAPDAQIYEAASKILSLAKNFEKLYPNFENLRRFHEVSFDDVNEANKLSP